VIGCVCGVLSVLAIEFIDNKLKIDDPVGAIAVHGVGGAAGTILVGVFSTTKGLLYGKGIEFLGVQVLGVLVVTLWVGITTFFLFKFIEKTVGLRVPKREEIEGLDTNEHGLGNAYADFLPNIKLDGVLGEGKAEKPMDVPVDVAIPIAVSGDYVPETGKQRLTKIDIIAKESKFEDLKEAMNEIGVTGMTVTHVMGCGVQKGAAEYYRGVPVDIQLLPKIRVEIIVAKIPVEEVVAKARKVLYTGHIGDGKIFIYDVRDSVRVRTGETGYDAMQGINEA